ncbi:TetR family transcriptional regulator [Mycobacterium sp. ACS4331]|uniref:TetR/AcrR family transcriptional regulator n=1 Tax=Mycobacterium sp. ACS4331 TaxID=1834121 RepID=UPI0007FC9035|nr:TetR family transcriptional regulator [Mycobacterium sp. ACS4331]OBF22179.1 TetR family transcriptional regulator [Mycobacterium sp. ACS4331]
MTKVDGRRRRGRPAGASNTRDRILLSARELFARDGTTATSVRAIAAEAGVDPALVHHYFGTKAQLIAAAIDIPIDPERVLTVLRATPVEDLGRAVPALILPLWESDLGAHLKATLRAALAGDQQSIFAGFLREIVLMEIAPRVDEPPGSGLVRAEFAATQMLGVVMARYIFELQPFASVPIQEVIETIAPTLQRYLTDDIAAVTD